MTEMNITELRATAKSMGLDARGGKEVLMKKINEHSAKMLKDDNKPKLPEEVPPVAAQAPKPKLIITPDEVKKEFGIAGIDTSSIRRDKLLAEIRAICRGRATVEYSDDGNGARGFHMSGGKGTNISEFTTINQPDEVILRVARMFVSRKAPDSTIGEIMNPFAQGNPAR